MQCAETTAEVMCDTATAGSECKNAESIVTATDIDQEQVDKKHKDKEHEENENEDKKHEDKVQVDKEHEDKVQVDKEPEDTDQEDNEQLDKDQVEKKMKDRNQVGKKHKGNNQEDKKRVDKEQEGRNQKNKNQVDMGQDNEEQEDKEQEDKEQEDKEQEDKEQEDKEQEDKEKEDKEQEDKEQDDDSYKPKEEAKGDKEDEASEEELIFRQAAFACDNGNFDELCRCLGNRHFRPEYSRLESLLQKSILSNCVTVANVMMEYFPDTQTNELFASLLQEAAQMECWLTVELLVNSGRCAMLGESHLILAIKFNLPLRIVKSIAQCQRDTNVNNFDFAGCNAMDYAEMLDRVDIVEFLNTDASES